MENATKALIMAGGVLIAMLIIAAAVFLFNSYGNMAPTYGKILSENEVKKFNSNFTKFEGRKDITVQEIISIVNFVKDYKQENEVDISIITPFENNLTEKNNNDLVEVIKEKSKDDEGNILYYECTNITTNGPFGTVDYIEFE